MLEQPARQRVRMTKVCSKCGLTKPMSEFHFRKDSNKHRSECKSCWKYLQAARRYGITFEQAVEYYTQPTCMCCRKSLLQKEDKHLHHVNHTVKGIVCKDCNILLRQETEEDLHRLESCVSFMQRPRKNLFDKVNQQGSRSYGKRCGPSTTTCQTPLRTCKCCGRSLSLKHFYQQEYISGKSGYYSACKNCYKILVKTYKYNLTFEQVQTLRSKEYCDCCGTKLQVPYIHHVGSEVLGAVCRECNLYLEQETAETKDRLLACIKWIKGDDIV